MQALRFNTAIAALAASAILSVFTSCKKEGSDNPNPTGPTGTLTCKPISETDENESRLNRSWHFDSQGRADWFTIQDWNQAGAVVHPKTTIAYAGDSIQLVEQSADGGQPFVTTYYLSGAKFLYSTAGPDRARTRYHYDGASRMDSIIEQSRYRIISYNGDGLPSLVTVMNRDFDTGVPVDTSTISYEYDNTRTVSFNPVNDLAIAPGLDFVKFSRVITKQVSQEPQGQSQTVYSAFEYDEKGNIKKMTAVGSGIYGPSNKTFTYAYDCR